MSTGSALGIIFISSPPPLTSCTRLLSGLAPRLYVFQPGGVGQVEQEDEDERLTKKDEKQKIKQTEAKLLQIPLLTATSIFPLNRSHGSAEAAPPPSSSSPHFKDKKTSEHDRMRVSCIPLR